MTVSGSKQLGGTGVDTITIPGLSRITGFSATIQGAGATPTTAVVTASIGGGTVTLFSWMLSAGALVASTGTEYVSWVAEGN